jgi:hypothetical protein
MPDRELIVKWFEFCRVEDKCSVDCSYFDNTGSARECTNKLAKDILTLLKEQEAVARCKDCKHYFNGCCYSRVSNRINFTVEVPDDWFCADWERKEGR